MQQVEQVLYQEFLERRLKKKKFLIDKKSKNKPKVKVEDKREFAKFSSKEEDNGGLAV